MRILGVYSRRVKMEIQGQRGTIECNSESLD